MDRGTILVCIFVAASARSWAEDGAPPAERLPSVAPSEPTAALGTFRTRPGFRIEPVASEPLVRDPVAVDFDHQGRMFVVELPAYNQYAADEDFSGQGAVKLLSDADGDGVFETSSVYVDDLNYPTAVACYDGGVFVGAAPDLLYCKDHDGDGRADERRVVFTGFGADKAGESHLNSIRWGLDNRFYFSTSGAGGGVRSAQDDESPARSINSRGFVFDPRDTSRFELTSGGGQHGMSFDDWGRRFVCSNREPIALLMYDGRYLERNPYLAARAALFRIALGDEHAKLFRISPPEPWRVARTQIRAASEKGDYEGGQPFGFFTAATGVTVYRGDAWPDEYRGNILVGEPANNLVYRAQTAADGLSLIARRADQEAEFLASTDIWFRPVQFANGPDGTLYVLDMYRELIEGAAFIPPEVLQHIDVVDGVERGRIYRIVNDDHESGPLPDLTQLDTAALVALLAHPNGWHRDTASRLLYERQDSSTRAALTLLARRSQQPLGRLHALYALDGMGTLTPKILLPRLSDPHPEIRRHAVQLAERLLDSSPTIRSRLASMTADPELIVRYQLAFTLGALPEPERSHGLAALALRDRGNEWMELAIRSSAVESAGTLLALLADDPEYAHSDVGLAMMGTLATQVGKQQRPEDIAAVGRIVTALASQQTPLLHALVRQLSFKQGSAESEQLNAATEGSFGRVVETLLSEAATAANDDQQPVERRVSAIGMLELGALGDRVGAFTELLDPTQPIQIQFQAVTSLGRFSSARVPRLLVDRWTSLTPRVRSLASEVIFSRDEWISLALDAIDDGDLPPAVLDRSRLEQLARHSVPEIRSRASELAERTEASPRAEVLKSYESVLQMKGSEEQGRLVFNKHCSACHRLEGIGHELAPPLTAMKGKSPQTIMYHVLAPNREVDARYLTFHVVTKGGRIITGMIQEETATSITLTRGGGMSEQVLRIDIDELQSTGLSLMPEGLEKQVDRQSMADLIAYVLSVE